MKSKLIIILSFFLSHLFVGSAYAEEAQTENESTSDDGVIPPIENGFLYQNTLLYRHNPLGVGEIINIGYRKKLGDKPKDDLLFGNAHFHTGFELQTVGTINVTEAFFLIEPIALLQFRFSYGRLFTPNDGNPDLLYDISLFSNSTKAMASIPGAGLSACSIIKLQGQLRFPLGPLLVRNTTLYRKYAHMTNFEDREHFYDFNYDVVVESNGMLIHNDLDLLSLKSGRPWILGLRYSYTHPFNTHETIENGDVQRLGPIMAWQFKNKPNRNHFRDHYVLLLTQVHLQHPVRAGDATFDGEFDLDADPFDYTTSRAVPYIGLLWGFGGQFAKK
ncbi:MAG: hypothetical protein VX278_19010 [Myxococcota bacterium]|nr:hypothetical protein [Myxococcota bacterium]